MRISQRLPLAVFTPLVVACSLLVCCGSAQAETAGTGWEVEANTVPTNLSPGGEGLIDIRLYNTGGAPSNGTVTVTDTLPEGLTATATGHTDTFGRLGVLAPDDPFQKGLWQCSIGGEGEFENRVVTCTRNHPIPPGAAFFVPGEDPYLAGIGLYEMSPERLGVGVKVAAGPVRREANVVTVAGGGAVSSAIWSDPVVVNPSLPGFGFSAFNGWASNADGTLDTQAGSHPYELTINFSMNDYVGNTDNERNIDVNVPPGLVGNPTAIPQCPRQLFDESNCPSSDQIGVDRPELDPAGNTSSGLSFLIPVYNLVPPKGMPAQFGFNLIGIQTFLDAGVRTGSDNGITERVNNVTNKRDVADNSITLWGVPGEESHDDERAVSGGSNSKCAEGSGVGCSFGASSNAETKSLLTLPTLCGAPPRFTIEANTWQHPETIAKDEFLMHENDGENTPVGFGGCEKLVHFGPEMSIAPDTSFSDTPAGLSVELRIPPDSNPEGLGSSGVKDTTVVLPEGVAINPGQATGLEACQPSEENIGGGEAKREEEEGPATCPAASKVGTDEISTPLLEEPLKGNVYVLQQNPPNIGLLVAASAEGVNLKLVGTVHLNETTGQLTTTFENTPDLPFTTFKLNFSGGAQAALSTPTNCGVYGSSAAFTPWSSPLVENSSFTSSFQITAGPGGAPCSSNPLPFGPSMIAGATTDQAGGFTDFSLLLQAPDGQQRISRLQFKAPPGLLGMISQVPLCGEAQANAGTCSAASQIGHNVDAAGPGPYPFVVPEAGQPPSPIYLTGPYKGAPFGLSIVVPAVAGPFNLGLVVVRAKIEVDPLTSQITVTTDQLPQILDGIPLDLRTIDAVVDRPAFMFNPTSCASQSFSGTATSVQGTTASLNSHFQVGSCQSLKFDPNFKVATSGKTSRKDGASLNAKILYPLGALPDNQATSQANVGEVKVDLPKQLPSRLTTLQKACTAAQFESNPAGCPADSIVGHATAITPLLPVPVTGPAYFVSYGGAKFPELVIVLQGYGVTVDLHGETFISKAGITSSTFRHVPDVPITSFELNLPEGPFSALAANGNLCTTKLAMPTAFTGQNGAEVHESTPVSVTGCPKAKKASKHKTKKTGKGARKARKTSHVGNRRNA